MRNFFKKLVHINGSVLVFSIIILAIILVTSLSIISVSVIERRSTSSSAKSVQSFNVAQSCVERTMKAIQDANNDATLADLRTTLGGTCNGGNRITFNISGGNAVLIANDPTGANPGNCDNETSDLVSDIGTIRCIGTSNGTSRAIETAVAANNTSIFSSWPDGIRCKSVSDPTHVFILHVYSYNEPTGYVRYTINGGWINYDMSTKEYVDQAGIGGAWDCVHDQKSIQQLEADGQAFYLAN